MYIEAEKLTDVGLMKDMLEHTVPRIDESKMDLALAYKRSHSIIRSQLFYIKFGDVPSYVIGHLRTHSAAGQVWLVQSNRADWGGDRKADRNTLINAVLICNAEHLIQIGMLRLCTKASMGTVGVVIGLKEVIKEVDPELAKMMVPQCYRYGYCKEGEPCSYLSKGKIWRKENYNG